MQLWIPELGWARNEVLIKMNNMDVTIIGEESLPVSTLWRDMVRRFRKNKLAVVGLVVLCLMITVCVAAPVFTPYDPVLDMDLSKRLLPPGSKGHIFGTDDYGRDILARLLYGGRVSLLTGLLVSMISMVIGVFIGCVAGYFGGWLDSVLMRAVDIVMSFPSMVLAIAIMAALGPSQRNIILTLVLVGWAGFARITRAQILFLKETDYIEAARASGLGDRRIIINHLIPNALGPIIVTATLNIGGAILSAASLNFLGLGVDVAQAEWGVMLNQAKNYMLIAPYLSLFPGLAISITVLCMNWIGDGLRDVLDPRMRS